MIAIPGAELETFAVDSPLGALAVATAHPSSAFSAGTAELLAESSESPVYCINPRGLGRSTATDVISFERMVDDLESVRRKLALPAWVFWGMSGGGWLAQLYAHRYPQALAGIIVESACICFRERLADPSCALSPFFPAWGEALRARGLLVDGSHARALGGDATEWIRVDGVGDVFRRRGGPALLVAPGTVEESMRRAMPVLWTFDSRSWIGSLRVPALIIAGSADPVVPVHLVSKVHEAIAGSTFIVIEGGGHVPTAERRAGAIDAVRAFLRKRVQ
jgi:pimeloyl-ACP methyl ester carboxylesterase